MPTDPRRLKPVGFFTGGGFTRTHHLQVADDLLLLANGANIVAMQSYDNMRGYFENALADSITNRKKFRSGLSIHDISRPPRCKEIAFLEMPGFGINRLWWPGGRYAYRRGALRRLHGPHPLHRRSEGHHEAGDRVALVAARHESRRAARTSTLPPGRRVALHHMITAGDRGYGAWRDGGLTIHDISDPAKPTLLSHINWSPPFPGGTHTAAAACPAATCVVVADEANAEQCAKGTFHTFVVDVRAPENPVPIATLPTPTDSDFCALGTFGPHNLHENRPGALPQRADASSRPTTTPGVRVFDISDAFAPKEIASWVPPPPKQLDRSAAERRAGREVSGHLRARPMDCLYVTDWNAGLNVLQLPGVRLRRYQDEELTRSMSYSRILRTN